MANIANKFSENVPGQFYVDRQCIDCDLCRQCAPGMFKRAFSSGTTHSYVGRQPTTQREIAIAMDTMRACPVEAIGCATPVEQTDEYNDSTGSIGLFNAAGVA